MKKLIIILVILVTLLTIAVAGDKTEAKKEAKTETKTAEIIIKEAEIISIDVAKMEMTVKEADKEVKLVWHNKTEILMGKDKKLATDLKVGTKVTVAFIVEKEKNLAKKIELALAESKPETK
jgi:hypothetical protein